MEMFLYFKLSMLVGLVGGDNLGLFFFQEADSLGVICITSVLLNVSGAQPCLGITEVFSKVRGPSFDQ